VVFRFLVVIEEKGFASEKTEIFIPRAVAMQADAILDELTLVKADNLLKSTMSPLRSRSAWGGLKISSRFLLW